MLASSSRMLRKAYSTVAISGGASPSWAKASTDRIKPTPMTATSRSAHSQRVGLAFRLLG